MKNCFYLAVGFLFLFATAQAEVDCAKTMDQIDEINEMQLNESVGPNGESLGEILSRDILLTRASNNLKSMRLRSQSRGTRFRLSDEIARRQLFLNGGELLALISPECADLEDQEKINGCKEALLKEIHADESEALDRLETRQNQALEILREQNRTNKKLVSLSLIKKKLAQDFVRSCDTTSLQDDELKKLETIHCPHVFESGGTATLRTLITDNMKIVQFLEIEQSAVSDGDMAQACSSLAQEGVEVGGCSEALSSHRQALAQIESGQQGLDQGAPQIGSPSNDDAVKVTDLRDDGGGEVTYENVEGEPLAEASTVASSSTSSSTSTSTHSTARSGSRPTATGHEPSSATASSIGSSIGSSTGTSTTGRRATSSQASRDCPSGTTYVAGRCWEPCSEPWEYRRSSDAKCMVDESKKEEIKKHRRNRTWKKIGKFAAITALAGGAIAAGAWAIGKLSDDNGYTPSSSSAYSGSFLPRTYRSSHLYPNYMPYGNMNYGQFYNYPHSFGDSSWIGQQQFERTSPYSVESFNSAGGGNQAGSQPFSFGF